MRIRPAAAGTPAPSESRPAQEVRIRAQPEAPVLGRLPANTLDLVGLLVAQAVLGGGYPVPGQPVAVGGRAEAVADYSGELFCVPSAKG